MFLCLRYSAHVKLLIAVGGGGGGLYIVGSENSRFCF